MVRRPLRTHAGVLAAQALAQEAGSVDRAVQRAHLDARALEEEGLRALSEATTAEKSSAKTAADIKGEQGLGRVVGDTSLSSCDMGNGMMMLELALGNGVHGCCSERTLAHVAPRTHLPHLLAPPVRPKARLL